MELRSLVYFFFFLFYFLPSAPRDTGHIVRDGCFVVSLAFPQSVICIAVSLLDVRYPSSPPLNAPR